MSLAIAVELQEKSKDVTKQSTFRLSLMVSYLHYLRWQRSGKSRHVIKSKLKITNLLRRLNNGKIHNLYNTPYYSNRRIWDWPDTHRLIDVRYSEHIFTINLGG